MPCSGSFGRPRTGVALVDIGQCDTLTGGDLYCLGKPSDFSGVIRAGRPDVQREQMAESVERQMRPKTLLTLGSTTARSLHSGEEHNLRLSAMAALGCASRPSAKRSTIRRSLTWASKPPSANQRRAH